MLNQSHNKAETKFNQKLNKAQCKIKIDKKQEEKPNIFFS